MKAQKIKKTAITSFVSSMFFLIVSCSIISDIRGFENPETITIKSSGTSYSLPLGKAEAKLSDNLSISDIEELIEENSKAKVAENSSLESVSIEVYDYWDNAENDVQKYIFNYPLADIPLDFSSYLEKLDGFNFSSKENSLSQEILIPNLDINFAQSLNLDFDEIIRKSVNIAVPGIVVAQTGSSTPVEVGLDGIPVNFVEPDFATIEFLQGDLVLTFEELSSSDYGNAQIHLQATIYDNLGNEISSSSGYSIVRAQDGTLTPLTIPMDGKILKKNIRIDFKAKSYYGTLGKLSKFNATLNFSNDTKIHRTTGLTIKEENLTPYYFNVSTTVDTSELKAFLKSGKINSGSISYEIEAPSAWSGVSVSPDIKISGDMEILASEFEDASLYSNLITNKSVSLNGKALEPDTGIKLSGTVPFSINNATITLSDDDELLFSGGVYFEKLNEAQVYADKLIDSLTSTKEISQSLGDDVQDYVESVSFSKFGFEGNLISDLPPSNLQIEPIITSTFFGIPGSSPLTQKIGMNEPSTIPINLTKEYESVYKVSDLSNDIDMKIEMSLSSADTENPNLVTFESINLGQKYKFDFDITPIFDWTELRLNGIGKTIEGTFDSGFNLNSFLATGVSDNAVINDALSKIEFSPSALSGYVFITRPDMPKEDGGDFLSGFDIFSGSIKGIYGSNEEYLFPKSGTTGTLSFSSGVKSFAQLADSEKRIRDISPAFKDDADRLSKEINGSVLLAMMNSNEDFSLKYSLGVATSDTGGVVIKREDVDSLKTAGKETDIKVNIAMILSLKLNITDKIVIEDTFSAFGLETKDDLFGRESADDETNLKKMTDFVKEVRLKYLFKNNSGFSISAYFTAENESGEVYLGKNKDGEYTKVLALNSNPTSTWENDNRTINLTESEINSFYENYPFVPKIRLEIGDGEIKVPRNASFGAQAVLTVVTQGEYMLKGGDDDE